MVVGSVGRVICVVTLVGLSVVVVMNLVGSAGLAWTLSRPSRSVHPRSRDIVLHLPVLMFLSAKMRIHWNLVMEHVFVL